VVIEGTLESEDIEIKESGLSAVATESVQSELSKIEGSLESEDGFYQFWCLCRGRQYTNKSVRRHVHKTSFKGAEPFTVEYK
jgi:hypothetical protein